MNSNIFGLLRDAPIQYLDQISVLIWKKYFDWVS